MAENKAASGMSTATGYRTESGGGFTLGPATGVRVEVDDLYALLGDAWDDIEAEYGHTRADWLRRAARVFAGRKCPRCGLTDGHTEHCALAPYLRKDAP